MLSRRLIAVPALAMAMGSALAGICAPSAMADETVDCAAGPVTLAQTGQTYILIGSCSRVRIDAANISVRMSSAQRLTIQGAGAQVTASGRVTRLDASGSDARISIARGAEAAVSGSGGSYRFKRLSRLEVSGSGNTVRVKHGTTRVSVTGTANHVRVHHCAQS